MKDNLLKLDLESQLQPTRRPVEISANTQDDVAWRMAQLKFFGLDKLFPSNQH